MDTEKTIAEGLIKLCCVDKSNLKRTVIAYDKVVDVCQVCGCRHFRMLAEPGHIGTMPLR